MPNLRIAEFATLTMPQSSWAASVPRGSKGSRLLVSNTTNELLSIFDATEGDFQDWHPSWNIKPHRALVLASGYYEWKTDPATKKKTPFYIYSPNDELLALAGLYSWWKDHSKADDDPTLWTLTATILTSSAVDELLHIHDRNPVPLPQDWWDDWLNPDLVGDQHFGLAKQ